MPKTFDTLWAISCRYSKLVSVIGQVLPFDDGPKLAVAMERYSAMARTQLRIARSEAVSIDLPLSHAAVDSLLERLGDIAGAFCKRPAHLLFAPTTNTKGSFDNNSTLTSFGMR